MGVKNLWDILESCKKTLPLHHLQNKRLCVDLSCWMVQLQSVNRSHCPLKDKVYLKGLFHRLRALIALNCSLIFVTDGAIPAIKLSTYRRRLNSGNQAIQDTENPLNVSSIKRNMGSEFSCMIKEAKFLGMALGIPCLNGMNQDDFSFQERFGYHSSLLSVLDKYYFKIYHVAYIMTMSALVLIPRVSLLTGIEEAEAQCALLNSESLCDGCFTSDSDAFLFGARTVYRDICLGEGGYVVCYEMDDIERELGFGKNSLIALAILLGSDYTHGVRGFGPESACQIVKSIGDLAVLQRFALEGLSILKKQKSSRKKGQTVMCNYKENNVDHGRHFNGSECGLSMDNQFVQVINAYLKPKCYSADSDVVHRVLAVFPFDRSQLHQICARYFEWPPEKTDEYILPKIAERNLRRFANLRSTSTSLGLHMPINEMPVKCPISSIVKQRKIQGRDYFEVSWEDLDGLKASSVPADLVESACPEKIMEFQQRKAQKKKPARRSRPKKAENRADMKEIDKKLQELMLEIGQESSTMANTVSLGGLVPGKTYSLVNVNVHQQQHLNTESESSGQEGAEINNRKSSSSVCNSATRYLETEIIDLISPPPRVHNNKVSKWQETKAIDLNARGSKPIKAVNCVDMVDVDEKLQKLLLDIEQESSTMTTVAHVDADKLGMHLNTGLARSSWEGAENDNIGSFNSSCFSTTKMIDLVSPPPRVHTHEVPKCQDAKCIDVIDLSDTDNDVSPEHARKVEDLRSFIASIRDEIS